MSDIIKEYEIKIERFRVQQLKELNNLLEKDIKQQVDIYIEIGYKKMEKERESYLSLIQNEYENLDVNLDEQLRSLKDQMKANKEICMKYISQGEMRFGNSFNNVMQTLDHKIDKSIFDSIVSKSNEQLT